MEFFLSVCSGMGFVVRWEKRLDGRVCTIDQISFSIAHKFVNSRWLAECTESIFLAFTPATNCCAHFLRVFCVKIISTVAENSSIHTQYFSVCGCLFAKIVNNRCIQSQLISPSSVRLIMFLFPINSSLLRVICICSLLLAFICIGGTIEDKRIGRRQTTKEKSAITTSTPVVELMIRAKGMMPSQFSFLPEFTTSSPIIWMNPNKHFTFAYKLQV